MVVCSPDIQISKPRMLQVTGYLRLFEFIFPAVCQDEKKKKTVRRKRWFASVSHVDAKQLRKLHAQANVIHGGAERSVWSEDKICKESLNQTGRAHRKSNGFNLHNSVITQNLCRTHRQRFKTSSNPKRTRETQYNKTTNPCAAAFCVSIYVNNCW